jgi:hypothetical protein
MHQAQEPGGLRRSCRNFEDMTILLPFLCTRQNEGSGSSPKTLIRDQPVIAKEPEGCHRLREMKTGDERVPFYAPRQNALAAYTIH